MQSRKLSKEARDCRAQAEAFAGAERALLLKVADILEILSAAEERRQAVDDARCW